MKLIVVRGGREGKEFKIEEGSNLIGRWDPDGGSFPEIDLEEDDAEAKVSRKHAVIERNGEVLTLEDIGSKNGTWIGGGEPLQPGKKYPLSLGTEIIVGKTVLKLAK